MKGASDLAVTPFFDGRAGLLDTWGGSLAAGPLSSIRLQSRYVHSSPRALAFDLGLIKAGESRYFQCFSSGFGPAKGYYQTRDLSCYERLEFWARNGTGVPLVCRLQIRDYRDSDRNQASYAFSLPAGVDWIRVVIPLDVAGPHWTQNGHPDLGQVLAINFVFAAKSLPASGDVYLEDVELVDHEGPLSIDSAPLPTLVERLTHRQWQAVWAARSRIHGLIPNNSYQSTDAGINSTAAMLWALPAAIRHHWVTQAGADEYVGLLMQTVGRLLDRAKYLPPRNVDWVTLQPSLLPEESSVDAAFLALAMHRYKTLSSTSLPLRKVIDSVENRFDFAAFGSPSGWRMAFRYTKPDHREGCFTPYTYDGYTNEGNVVSLAAHLADRRHVPIETYWNASANRVRAQGTAPARMPVVHSLTEFRAPFTQALWNLFVDVRGRGPDEYPDNRLAVNPWDNFVCYEQNVMNFLAQEGRAGLVQPDAGDDGSLGCYRQFSTYENFGQGDLFMPWSVSFALLAGADGAENALRHLLRGGLYGPFGLADSAKWSTGAPAPYAVAVRQDFWNTGLATIALLEFLDSDARQSKSFAELPEVRLALDRVFHSLPASRAALMRPASFRP